MDRVLRAYAHTAWTAADPLAGLDPELRRAILLMPSTFRERWKLAPWTDRHQRRLAIADIIAERRLLYELTNQNLEKSKATPASTPLNPVQGGDDAVPASPYYQYRLGLRTSAMDSLGIQRREQDLDDIEHLPEARADFERRIERRRALLALAIERADLDHREFDIMAGREVGPLPRHRKKAEKGR